MSQTIELTTSADVANSIGDLRSQCTGPVLVAGDAGFDEAAASWNLTIQQRPAVVVVAHTTADVRAAIAFASSECLPVAVKGTGHGTTRAADGAVLVFTGGLRELEVDPVERTARIGAGLKWADVLPELQRHGLAPLLGSSPDVGVVGYTLGGGFGWLGRKYGLQADHVRAIELVTASGLSVRATKEANPELYWALRGAGAGSFGVVTAIEIDLVLVDSIYAGNLFWPAEMAAEVAARWQAWAPTTPRELTSALVFINFPPIEDVPPPLRGRSFVGLRGCFTGDEAHGRALIDGWRTWKAPELDLFHARPFGDIAAVSMDPVDPLPYRITTESFDEVPEEVTAILARATFPAGGPPSFVFSEIRHAGDVPTHNAGSLDRGRRAPFLLTVLAVPHAPEALPTVDADLAALHASLAPHVTGATYLNFTDGDQRRERTPSAFDPNTMRRLTALKHAVDPRGLFSHGLPLG